VAFELLTGRRPFVADNPAAQAIAHVDKEPPAATEIAPGLPDAVDGVLRRGLAKDPGQRPPTAAALVQELHGALGPTATTGVAHPVPTEPTRVATSTPLPQRPRTPRRPMPAVAAAAASEPRTPPPSAGRPVAAKSGAPRNRARLLAVAATVLLLVGAAALALAGGSNDKPTTAARDASDQRAKPAKKPAAKPKAKPAATPATQSTPQTTTTAAPTSGAPADAAQIQADAHQKILNGDYAGAVGELQGLVNRCDVQITDPCAYAWFDLGYALRRAGDPQDAVGVLEHRLQNSNQSGTVQAELDAARAEAEGGKPGKAKGHFKKGD
jgi:serine/threonine-protein kinase